MKKLVKPKAAIKTALYEHNLKDLIYEELLAIIYSYRKGEYGCHYSITQWAELCYTSEPVIKRRLKALRECGLVNSQRVYNNATRYWPSKKFLTYIEKGQNDPSVAKEKGQNRTVGQVKMTSYTSSKEEEGQKQKKHLSFMRDTAFEKRALDYTNAGMTNQQIQEYYETWLSIKNPHPI